MCVRALVRAGARHHDFGIASRLAPRTAPWRDSSPASAKISGRKHVAVTATAAHLAMAEKPCDARTGRAP